MEITKFKFEPANIYVYLRVSTRNQANREGGLDEQNKICSEYLKKYYNKYPNEYFSEVGSSYNNKNKLSQLEKINRKIVPNSLIIIRDTSRLGRNVFQVFSLLRKIKKTNSHIISISENLCYNYSNLMDKEFFHKVIDSEKDSDIKSIKLKEKISNIKSQGGWIGKAYYGTQIIKQDGIPRLFQNPNEINVIKMMAQQFVLLKNITKVRIDLNKNELLSRKGFFWKDKEIKNILSKYYPELFVNSELSLKPKDIVNKNILSNVPILDTDK